MMSSSEGEGPSPDLPTASEELGVLSKDECTMAMLCHLLAIVTAFIGPLIVWLMKKDESKFVDDQGKEALNFQLTVLIAFVVSALSICIVIGVVLLPAVAIFNLVFCIIAAVRANGGEAYRYPLNLRMVR